MIPLLFVISIIHGLIFATAQEVTRFLSPALNTLILPIQGWITLPLYVSGTIMPLLSQWCSRKIGIKNVFLGGLISNFVGMALFSSTRFLEPDAAMVYFLLVLGMIFLGIAISSVATVLGTYVVLQFSKKVALGLILLYSCLDIGVMFSQPIFDFFDHRGEIHLYLVAMCVVMALFIAIIIHRFKVDEIPKHLLPLRRGSLVWNALHFRMALFILAMVLYGFLESSFSLFGREYIHDSYPFAVVDKIIFAFWMTLLCGQICIGIPAFWVSPGKVMRILPVFILLATILVPLQQDPSGLMLSFLIGGIGCSAAFPLLLAMLQLELSRKDSVEMLPHFESACGYMVAAYIFGVGLVSCITQIQKTTFFDGFKIDLQVSIGLAAGFLLLTLFLDRSTNRINLK